MASTTTIQPAQLWTFERPGTGTPVRSEEVRNNFNSLGRLNFTCDEQYPEVKRDGMPRVNAADPNNVKLQVWYDNAWRTVFQFINLGFPSPAKQEAQFNPGVNPWVIDHNIGSRPLVQAYDVAGNVLQLVSQNPASRDWLSGPMLSPAVLTGLGAGPTALWTWVATFRGAINDLVLEVMEDVTGSHDATFDATINGTPTTGGDLNLTTTPILGDRLAGGAPSADNEFEVGDTVQIRVTLNSGSFTGGAVRLNLDVERRLQAGQYVALHATENRVILTHPAPTAGFALVLG